MQGPFAELRADDQVENAGAELIADALHLCEHGVWTADNHLAEGDAVGEVARDVRCRCAMESAP